MAQPAAACGSLTRRSALLRAGLSACLSACLCACATTSTTNASQSPDVILTASGAGVEAARAKLDAGDVAAALMAAQNHVVERPNDPRGHFSVGTLLAMTGDLPGAEAALSRAVALDTSFGAAYNNLGLVRLRRGNRPEAQGALYRAVELMPGSIAVQLNLAGALLASGKWNEALENYEAALAMAPEDAEAMLGVAMAMSMVGRRAEALVLFDRILDKNPRSVDAHVGKSVALREMARFDDAIHHADAAVRLSPASPTAMLVAALARDFNKDAAGAEAYYLKALAVAPKHPGTLYNYGLFLLDAGRPEDGKSVLERYLESAPEGEAGRREVRLKLRRLEASKTP